MPLRKAPLARTLRPVGTKVKGRTPDINSAWVQFDADATSLLSQYLDDEAITQLREACSFVGAMYHYSRTNPISYAAERTQMLTIAGTAEQLAACLEHPSKDDLMLTAIIELGSYANTGTANTTELGSHANTGTANTTELRRLLRVVVDGCRARAKGFPQQSRRRTPGFQVRWVARVIETRGIKASAAPGSKFTRIVRTCFKAMGIHIDPGRAIRSYIEHRDDDPLRD